MSRLALQMHYPNGDMKELSYAEDVEFSTGEHGFEALTGFVPMSMREAFAMYQERGLPTAVLSDGVFTAFRGRVEDTAVVDGGLNIGSFGKWRAFYDLYYTALWADSSTAEWNKPANDDLSDSVQARFQSDNNNRLYFAPTKGEMFDDATRGIWRYAIPHRSDRLITHISFRYKMDAPSGWRAVLKRRDTDLTELTTIWTLDGNGSVQTADVSLSVTACESLTFEFFYNNGTAAEYTGETGDVYNRITIPIVKTTSTATIYADTIAEALLAFVYAENPTMVSSYTYRIESPGLDLAESVLLYEDALPGDILSTLASIGDDQTPPRRWETGVWEDDLLFFRPTGTSSQTWYIDIGDIELERTFNEVMNAVYAIYDQTNSRTETAVDDESVDAYGVKRVGTVSVQTSSDTLASTFRDAQLEDMKDGKARASIKARGVYDEMGAEHPSWLVRAGDTVNIRNLPPDLGELNQIRQFTLSGTKYHVNNDELTLIPAELPRLEFLVARQGI